MPVLNSLPNPLLAVDFRLVDFLERIGWVGCVPTHTRTTQPRCKKSKPKSTGSTHTGELDAAVTTLGSSALLLDVEVPELAARGLDDANLVGPRVVPVDAKEVPSIF